MCNNDNKNYTPDSNYSDRDDFDAFNDLYGYKTAQPQIINECFSHSEFNSDDSNTVSNGTTRESHNKDNDGN